MAIQTINTGSSSNAGDGDSLRSAFAKINSNFAELASAVSTSTVGPTGPRGPQGPASSVPGPTGPASTTPGPTGPSGPTGPAGADGARYLGPYSSSTTYVAGDLVIGNDNNSYIAVGETIGDDPAVAPNGLWDSFLPKGANGDTGPTGPVGRGYDNVYSTNDVAIANTGTLTLYVAYSGGFVAGSRVRIISTGSSSNWMEGNIVAVSQDFTIDTNIDASNGSGTYSDWQFAVTGIAASSANQVGNVTSADAGAIAFYSTTGTTLSGSTPLRLDGNTLRLGGDGVVAASLYYTREFYDNQADGFMFAQHHGTADAVNFSFYRTRGSATTSTAVQSGDDLADITFSGHDGTGRAYGAGINAIVDGTPTTGQIPTKIQFVSSNGIGQGVRAELSSSGTWQVNRISSYTPGSNLAVGTNLVPLFSDAYNLGSNTRLWKTLYVSTLTIRNSIVTGNYDNDNYSTFRQIENSTLANDGSGFYKTYNFLTEFEQATAITNEDATMNQVLILGDTGATSTATLFGVAVIDNSTGTYLLPTTGTETGWIQKLNLQGNGTLVLPTGGLTAAGHLVPTANLTYDLGTTSSQWRSIYVGTGTIYIGGVALGVNQNNFVTVDGNPIITINTAGNITIQGDDVTIGTVIISDTAPTASTGTQWFNTVDGRSYVAYNSVWVDASPAVVPPPSTYLGEITIDGSILNINSGTLTIDDAGTLLVNGSAVTGSGSNDYTPTTPADWTGIPTVGTVTEGLDELASRVSVVENAPVAPVTTSTLINGTYAVALTTSGVLTLSTASIIMGNSNDPNIYIEASTTTTTSTWTFGTDGILTLPADTPIIKGGGTGTDVTINATTGSNTATWVFDATGSLTFPDTTIQRSAYLSGQQTVYVNSTSTSTPISLTELTGSVVMIWPETGYATPSETHMITLPFQNIYGNPNISLGTRITVINQYNGTIDLFGWDGGQYAMQYGESIDLVYTFNPDYNGNMWWVIGSYIW